MDTSSSVEYDMNRAQLSNFLRNVFYIPEQEQPDFGDRAIFSNSSASFVQKITGPNSSLFLWTSILKRTKVTLFTKYFSRSLFGNCIGARANHVGI